MCAELIADGLFCRRAAAAADVNYVCAVYGPSDSLPENGFFGAETTTARGLCFFDVMLCVLLWNFWAKKKKMNKLMRFGLSIENLRRACLRVLKIFRDAQNANIDAVRGGQDH